MKYYKVVRYDGWGNTCRSISLPFRDKYSLTYTLNKKTIPKIGKIFAFAKLEDAKKLINDNISRFAYDIILVGNGKKARVQRKHCAELYNDAIKQFWNNGEVFIRPMWHGTVLLDHFTPTEIVF